MKLDDIKSRVCALLDIDAPESEARFLAVLDSVAKKTAVITKCIKKSALLTFEAYNGVYEAALPPDFAAFLRVCGGYSYGRENFEIISGKIRCKICRGQWELIYYAYPADINSQTDGETQIFADAYICDIVAYGAAMELCACIYPEDVQRYMRLATEYDERMANAISSENDANTVANGFFAGTRGVFI